jgi:hypothetical protein
MVIYFLWTARHPLDHFEDQMDIVQEINRGGRPELPGSMSLYMRDLLRSMWQVTSEESPSFSRRPFAACCALRHRRPLHHPLPHTIASALFVPGGPGNAAVNGSGIGDDLSGRSRDHRGWENPVGL